MMFENIFYQDRIVAQLRQVLLQSSLPPSLLFYGPPFSAKLTTALEFARAVTCSKGALWDCNCSECGLHRTLDYPYLFLVGQKSFLSEINVGVNLLLAQRTPARRYFLLRAVKKLLKRYDPILWEGEESKLKKLDQALLTVQDDLELLYPSKPLPDYIESVTQRLVENSKILAQALPQAGLLVHQIRRLAYTTRLTGQGHKFVLIEKAERIQESACNALLKILEEPPSNTTFVLLTSHKKALMATILSRLRPVAFHNRSIAEQRSLLAQLFACQEKEYGGLQDYFRSFETQPQNCFDQLAKTFFDSLDKPVFSLEKEAMLWDEDHSLPFFLESLMNRLRELEHRGALSLEKCEKIYRLIQQVLIRCRDYRVNIPLAIESLFYQIQGFS